MEVTPKLIGVILSNMLWGTSWRIKQMLKILETSGADLDPDPASGLNFQTWTKLKISKTDFHLNKIKINKRKGILYQVHVVYFIRPVVGAICGPLNKRYSFRSWSWIWVYFNYTHANPSSDGGCSFYCTARGTDTFSLVPQAAGSREGGSGSVFLRQATRGAARRTALMGCITQCSEGWGAYSRSLNVILGSCLGEVMWVKCGSCPAVWAPARRLVHSTCRSGTVAPPPPNLGLAPPAADCIMTPKWLLSCCCGKRRKAQQTEQLLAQTGQGHSLPTVCCYHPYLISSAQETSS